VVSKPTPYQRRRRRGGHMIVRSPRTPDLTIVRRELDSAFR
jgi:hypothetical protein